MTPDTDELHQLALFRQAVELLGGQRATARALGIAERTVRALVAGPGDPNGRKLHAGFLEDTAAALLKHADQCRELEKRLTPAFAGNLTERQRAREAR